MFGHYHEYIDTVQQFLVLPANIRKKIVDDLETSIKGRLAEKETLETILLDLGDPERLASEFNENYFEYNDVQYYEYKSHPDSDFPIVHIVIPKHKKDFINPKSKLPTAKGVFAFGARAYGVVTLGVFSTGLISFGILSFGLLSFGLLSLGLIALGSIAIGALTFSNIAFSLFAFGNLAFCYAGIGNYIIGRYGIANLLNTFQGVQLPNRANEEHLRQAISELLRSTNDSLAKLFFQSVERLLQQPLLIAILVILLVGLVVTVLVIFIKELRKIRGITFPQI